MPNWLRKSSEWRIGVLAVATALLLTGNIFIGAVSREASQGEIDEIGGLSEAIVSLSALQHAVDEVRRAVSNAHAAGGSPEAVEALRVKLSELTRRHEISEKHVRSHVLPAGVRDDARSLIQSVADVQSSGQSAFGEYVAGRAQSAVQAAAIDDAIALQSGHLNRQANALRAEFELTLIGARSRIKNDVWTANSLAFLSCLLCVVLGLVVFRRVVRPIRTQVAAMRELAAGGVNVEVTGAELPGDIGDMARSITKFRDMIRRKQVLEIEAAASRAAAAEERARKDEQDKYYIDSHAVFMTKFTSALERLSAGDLKFRLEDPFIGEYEGIRHSFNVAAGKISEAIVSIVSRAIEIRGGTDRILSAADELSRHTEEQASSLEETSASMEQMAATIRQNASNAQEASAVANVTRDLAAAGGKVASKAVGAMEKIERSSKQMTEIVGLIEEIAFQTNILALNAAVEAARAGDAGKGFAVVANEVRALSQRSSRSLKDIKSLIESSAGDVVEGVNLVKQAGGSLTEIVMSIKKASDLVAEIAAASQEQAAGVDQVSRAVANMDEMTQQNAALVQETTASLHTAQIWIQELHRVVSVFDTGVQHAPVPAEPQPVPHGNWVRERQHQIEKQMTTKRAVQARTKPSFSSGSAVRASAEFEREWQEL